MDFKKMKDMIIDMQEQNYDYFVKALISVEKGIEDEKVLDNIYSRYMEEDTMGLLDENFDYIIDEMRNDVIMVDFLWSNSILMNVYNELKNKCL